MKRLGAIFPILLAAIFPVAAGAQHTTAPTPPPTITSIVTLTNTSTLTPGQALTLPASGYLGYTESFAASFTEFLNQIGAIEGSHAILGIDSGVPGANRYVTDVIDLSHITGAGMRDPLYIGTNSDVTLAGPIYPMHSTAGGSGNTLNLVALNGARLEVASQIGSTTSPVNSVVIGHADWAAANTGVVQLSGENGYAGGTRILSGILKIDNGASLGFGAVNVGAHGTLYATASATINNTVSLEPGATLVGTGEFNSRISLVEAANIVPGGMGRIGMLHLHGGLDLGAGSILHIDLARTSHDMLCVWNELAIQGNALIPITINLYSISDTGGAGAYDGFNPDYGYSWTIAYRPDPNLVITGFDPAYFNINATDFNFWNPNEGIFGIQLVDNSLVVTFTPVPEPGTYALMALGLGALAVLRLRKRRG